MLTLSVEDKATSRELRPIPPRLTPTIFKSRDHPASLPDEQPDNQKLTQDHMREQGKEGYKNIFPSPSHALYFKRNFSNILPVCGAME
jgi:hypothetical protein